VQQKLNLAIGGFDGVHLAHQKLISLSDEVLIIEKNSSLTPHKERCSYIKKPCHFYYLDDIKHLTYLEFIEKIKIFNPSNIVVGYDFRFGKNRLGGIKELQKYFNVIVIDEIKIDNIGVHSKIIREFIKNGKIQKANKFLNHTYKIKAIQIKGQGIGKEKLLPTINLKPIYNYVIPKYGVYLTLINKLPSITFIGIRSTDNNFSIETHILNNCIQKEIYEIEFIDFLRENKKFNSIDELKKVIITDKQKAIKFFRSYNDIK
jgi:riboflavin kinase/FMN adenylyltransferase